VTTAPRIAGVGTAVPADVYTQDELVELWRVTDERAVGFFRNGGIQRRHLTLPEGSVDKRTRHLDLATRALTAAAHDAGLTAADIGHLAVVTSTGFMVPGLSAHLMAALGMDPGAGRVDVVGMGCNAGLNALGPLAAWAAWHPGRAAALVCVESFSGAFVHDGSLAAAVVNSLFGDGAAALVIRADGHPDDAPGGAAEGAAEGAAVGPAAAVADGPRLLDFASLLVPDAINAMRVEWDATEGKRRFVLERDVPRVVEAHAGLLVDRLLSAQGLTRADVAHWCVHSGGKKVVAAVRAGLGLGADELRHTTGVLRDFGNVSSGSFLFSYERLKNEGVTCPGEYGVMLTMGPGSTIEAALLGF
jgi:predicted naringenin-chalcone synthase